jgi:hypothetical protein
MQAGYGVRSTRQVKIGDLIKFIRLNKIICLVVFLNLNLGALSTRQKTKY